MMGHSSEPLRLVLVGTSIAAGHAIGDSSRYNLANAYLDAFVSAYPTLGSHLEVVRFDFPFALGERRHGSEVAQQIISSRPDVLGLSCYAWDLGAQLQLARQVRAALPSVRVVLGGPSASWRTVALLEAHPAVDAAVRGEGEETLAELLSAGWEALSGVAGLTWRASDGSIHEERPRRPSPDLAKFRSPILDGKIAPPKHNLLLEFSRGCIYRCRHCAWQTIGSGIRTVPSERVSQEIAWAIERGYRHAMLIDSAINSDDAWLKEMTAAVARANPDGQLAFSYFLHYRFVRSAQIAALKAIPSHELLLGLESVNPHALALAGRKPEVKEDFSQVVDLLASEIGPTSPSVMIGLPGDTLEGFRETLDYLVELAERPGPLRVRHARVSWTILPPGSYFAENAERYGIRIHPDGVPYVLGTSEFPEEHMREALHMIVNHRRADLFVWEDVEPMRLLGGDLPDLLAPAYMRVGAPVRERISDEHA